MKKEIAWNVFFSVLLVVAFVGLVSAQDSQAISENVKAGVEGAASGLKTVIGDQLLVPLFGEQEYLTRLFFFILLYMIIWQIVGAMFRFDESNIGGKIMAWAVPAIIATLAMIALPVNFIESIRTSYGAMGAAILSIIPFTILLIFSIRIKSLLAGRMVWMFFIVYYFTLYLYMVLVENKGFWTTDNIPYIAAIGAGLLIFFGLGAFRRMYFKGEMDEIKEAGREVALKGKLLHRLQDEELQESYLKGDKK